MDRRPNSDMNQVADAYVMDRDKLLAHVRAVRRTRLRGALHYDKPPMKLDERVDRVGDLGLAFAGPR